MGTITLIAIIVTLIIIPTLIFSLKTLRRIERRLGTIEEFPDDSVHDTLHPVFSARQIRFARQRFIFHYKKQLSLTQRWQDGQDSVNITKPAVELPPSVEKEMREICEALVEAECAWKEYEYMISGNVEVANRGASARSIVEEWNLLLKKTRGAVDRYAVNVNPLKMQRADEWFKPWRERILDQGPDAVNMDQVLESPGDYTREDLFHHVWEDRNEWEGWRRALRPN